jgi:sulfatase modifying factor 1
VSVRGWLPVAVFEPRARGLLLCLLAALLWGCSTSGSDAAEGGLGEQRVEEPPSCQGLAKSCGHDSSGNCCESLLVPGGTFNRSNLEEFPATVSPFLLDKYQVTVGRFRRFLQDYDAWRAKGHPVAGEGAHPLIEGSGWEPELDQLLPENGLALRRRVQCDADYETFRFALGETENHPINCVSFAEARAFCIWDGGRLPTEAEWNFAAAGGEEQRTFPWGEEMATPENRLAAYGCRYDGERGCTPADMAKVGMLPFGDARWGHSDMAGNAFDWALDWYTTYTMPCIDCAQLEPTLYRVIRGGYFDSISSWITSERRSNHVQTERIDYISIRCARLPKEAP